MSKFNTQDIIDRCTDNEFWQIVQLFHCDKPSIDVIFKRLKELQKENDVNGLWTALLKLNIEDLIAVDNRVDDIYNGRFC